MGFRVKGLGFPKIRGTFKGVISPVLGESVRLGNSYPPDPPSGSYPHLRQLT